MADYCYQSLKAANKRGKQDGLDFFNCYRLVWIPAQTSGLFIYCLKLHVHHEVETELEQVKHQAQHEVGFFDMVYFISLLFLFLL